MSTLWNVRVLKLEGSNVKLEVQIDHPDAGVFEVNKFFALRLLVDEAWAYNDSFEYATTGPLGEAISFDNIHNEQWITTNASYFIKTVTVSTAQQSPFDEAAVNRKIDEKVKAKGLIKKPDSQEWEDAWQAEWDVFWQNPANLPVAIYKIEVTEPKWLAHLKAEQHWHSAAYG